jgi:multicomponent Na+:H+ antiporter subunit B
MLLLDILLILMIAGAIIALEVRDLLSSVVAVGAVGLLLSVAFLVLQAPDVAITQLSVEIIAVIFLIRATLRAALPSSPVGSRPAGALLAGGFVVVFLLFAYGAFLRMPLFGQPIMRVAETYLTEGLEATGAVNLVTSVILDYRAYDTLGETTVLFAAVIGVITVMSRIGRKPTEEAGGR